MTKDNHLLGKFELGGIPPAPRGQPQIEVTFEIDSNGILNVGAEDKGTGKSEKITITNDKGRLTEEQIEKMIREAEEFADEDKKVKERVDAKNAFDGYIHSMRSATEGSGDNKGLSEKMDSDEKEKILDALKDGQSWLDSNPEADAEEIKEKHKEIEGICAPIVSKYYGGGGAGGAGGVMSEEALEALRALEQLGERLGLQGSDTEKIFHGVVEERLKEMMIPVRDAWEEATYTKEALMQLNKERGKDLGDDPTADGTGAELGIKDSPPLEGVRGFKLMEELSKVADFYTRNKVLKEDAVDPTSEDEDAWAAAYPVQVGKWIEDKNKEEMYGIFVWNAITCQDTAARDKWNAAKTVVGGILGLSPKLQQKVLVRMVSRWCNMFIKSKVQEQGELKKDDVSMLTDWAPMFFGIEKDVTMDMVQAANKSLLQNKVLKILNKPSVTPEDLSKLRAEVEEWDLEVAKDLELSRPQLRSLFKVEVASVVEDPDLTDEQKVDGIEASREAFGLAEKEAMSEMQDLIKSRCRSCLVNASGDLLQENEAAAVDQMQRLELLAAFGLSAGVEFQDDWEVAPAMRQKLLKIYTSGSKGRAPDTRMLERVLSLVHA
ncbi:BIP8 [Symbiodinium pilosum]|uniref:BIP8 protein n=1 Tax=Symbiodinium pilosum TaxID=2952 RepID=A0A812WVK1_SYMPI|nr:BIP8 [Symbiodinium pilosum]